MVSVVGYTAWETDQEIVGINNELTDTPILGHEISESEIDTSHWLTYRNEEYGFEVKYPSNRKINERKSYVSYITIYNPNNTTSHGTINIIIRNNPNNLTIREYYKELSQNSKVLTPDYFEFEGAQYTTVDGIEAVQFPNISTPPAPIVVTRTSILINKKIIEIDLEKRVVEENGKDESKSNKLIYKIMLDSFHFIK